MDYKDLISHENINIELLPDRTKRLIAKYEKADDQEKEDLNDYIVSDIAVFIAEKQEKEHKQSEPRKSLMQRLAARYSFKS